MRKIISSLFIALFAFTGVAISSPANAATVPGCPGVYVNPYFRSNGTYVKGYCRSAPNNTITDNYSYPGNTNPFTGITSGEGNLPQETPAESPTLPNVSDLAPALPSLSFPLPLLLPETLPNISYNQPFGLQFPTDGLAMPSLSPSLLAPQILGDSDSSEAEISNTTTEPKQYNPVTRIKQDLGKGVSGEDVSTLQKFLIAEKWMKLPKNAKFGTFGALTEKGLKKFQKYVNIPVSGKFDLKTRETVQFYN